MKRFFAWFILALIASCANSTKKSNDTNLPANNDSAIVSTVNSGISIIIHQDTSIPGKTKIHVIPSGGVSPYTFTYKVSPKASVLCVSGCDGDSPVFVTAPENRFKIYDMDITIYDRNADKYIERIYLYFPRKIMQ